jgi:tRNA (guanine-N7-)-methyltransferase
VPHDNDSAGRSRPIRSYVRRAGRLTSSQRRALDDLWPDYGIEFAPQLLDLDSIFNRAAPRVLEIGFGNGESLVQLAIDDPASDFLGVDVHDPGIGHCLISAHDARVTNLRLISHDAIDVLEMQIPHASLSRINLYFPDPWPKKRHHKRRIVQPEFLTLCAARLGSNGSLHIATDWANYAEHIDETLGEFSGFECTERREHDGDQPLDRAATKFERRGVRHGHRIWDWRFVRIDL